MATPEGRDDDGRRQDSPGMAVWDTACGLTVHSASWRRRFVAEFARVGLHAKRRELNDRERLMGRRRPHQADVVLGLPVWGFYGANGQITKPFEAQALVERVNEVMSAPLASSETPAAPAATVGVFSDLGSRAESPATSGLVALVQSAKALEASKAIESLGGVVEGMVSSAEAIAARASRTSWSRASSS